MADNVVDARDGCMGFPVVRFKFLRQLPAHVYLDKVTNNNTN